MKKSKKSLKILEKWVFWVCFEGFYHEKISQNWQNVCFL